jgi:hypothetical protein
MGGNEACMKMGMLRRFKRDYKGGVMRKWREERK